MSCALACISCLFLGPSKSSDQIPVRWTYKWQMVPLLARIANLAAGTAPLLGLRQAAQPGRRAAAGMPSDARLRKPETALQINAFRYPRQGRDGRARAIITALALNDHPFACLYSTFGGGAAHGGSSTALGRRRLASWPCAWLPAGRPTAGSPALAYSIPGSIRSGGLLPSAKVWMFRITRSPISTRPSTVALPIWGSSTTLGRLRRRGLASWPCS